VTEGSASGGMEAAPWRVITIAIAIGTVTWLMALPSSVSGVETWAFRLFNDLPDWLEMPTWPIMQMGALAMVPIAAGLVYLSWRRWQPAIAVLGAGTEAWLISRLVKELVGRGRPATLLDRVNLRPAWDGFGFLSGHTTIAFAIATIVGPRLGRTGKVLIWSGAVATGLLRMYTGAHLPLDVIGGAALGIALGSLGRWAVGELGIDSASTQEGREST